MHTSEYNQFSQVQASVREIGQWSHSKILSRPQ